MRRIVLSLDQALRKLFRLGHDRFRLSSFIDGTDWTFDEMVDALRELLEAHRVEVLAVAYCPHSNPFHEAWRATDLQFPEFYYRSCKTCRKQIASENPPMEVLFAISKGWAEELREPEVKKRQRKGNGEG